MYTVLIQEPSGYWAQTHVSESKYSWAARKAWQMYKKIPNEVVLEKDALERIRELNGKKFKGPHD